MKRATSPVATAGKGTKKPKTITCTVDWSYLFLGENMTLVRDRLFEPLDSGSRFAVRCTCRKWMDDCRKRYGSWQTVGYRDAVRYGYPFFYWAMGEAALHATLWRFVGNGSFRKLFLAAVELGDDDVFCTLQILDEKLPDAEYTRAARKGGKRERVMRARMRRRIIKLERYIEINSDKMLRRFIKLEEEVSGYDLELSEVYVKELTAAKDAAEALQKIPRPPEKSFEESRWVIYGGGEFKEKTAEMVAKYSL